MFETEELQIKAFKKIIEFGLSVRQAEELAKKNKLVETLSKKIVKDDKKPEIFDVEENLGKLFGTKVNITKKGKTFNKGRIEISYYSIDDLNRLIEIFQNSFYPRRKSIEDIL